MPPTAPSPATSPAHQPLPAWQQKIIAGMLKQVMPRVVAAADAAKAKLDTALTDDTGKLDAFIAHAQTALDALITSDTAKLNALIAQGRSWLDTHYTQLRAKLTH